MDLRQREEPAPLLRRWMEGLSELFLLRSQPPSRWPATFWVTIATISTVAAAFVALQPGRLGDLRLVREWLRYWTASA